MVALLATGIAILMTAVGVMIGGLALELLLFAISRSLEAQVAPRVERTGRPAAIHLRPSDGSMGTTEWADEVAA